MKIKTTERPFLPLGPAHVRVTSVEDDQRSEYQGVPYLNVRLENEDGFVEQRFYLSEAGQPILAEFVRALGLDPAEEHDTQDFVGRELLVDIEDYTYEAPDTGSDRTIKQATHFRETSDAAEASKRAA